MLPSLPQKCILVSLLLILGGCGNNTSAPSPSLDIKEKKVASSFNQKKEILHNEGTTIQERIQPPEGFQRVSYAKNSFANFLQNFPLKAADSPVKLYDGSLKSNQNVHIAVLDIDVGKRDLQQCADAVMRLRAEYLWAQNRYDDIHFNFTNGMNVAYSKWRAGNRMQVSGNKTAWIKTDKESTSKASFREYMQLIFTYAGTLSLSKELSPKKLSELEVGDVFIQGGSPGHAVLVVDKAANLETGEQLFCIAQSYMPAQDIHVLKNLSAAQISPWYKINDIQNELNTPEWVFYANNLKSF